MPINRPTPLATPFSDNANYPAGAHPWNGTATKVAMSAGEIAAGYEPTARPPAQKFDWLLNWITNAILYLLGVTNGGEKPVQLLGNGVNVNVTSVLVSSTGAGWSYTSACVDLPVGARILAYRAVYSASGVQPITFLLKKYADASGGSFGGTSTVPGSSSTTNVAGFQDATVGITPTMSPIATGDRYFIQASGNEGTDLISQLHVFWDVPVSP